MLLLQNYLRPVYYLFFPAVCQGCGNELLGNEKTICTTCLSFLPKTKFHLIINNPMEQKMAVRVRIEQAIAMYYFNKGGVVQNLLHALKYRNQQEIGVMLGKLFAREIEDQRWLPSVDVVMPVPLSIQKIRMRGYNQSECIARGLATYLQKPLDTQSLIRVRHTATQTHKTRAERLINVADAFSLTQAAMYTNKHILLVDDVITTGATLEVCAAAILKIPGLKVSLACLAYAAE